MVSAFHHGQTVLSALNTKNENAVLEISGCPVIPDNQKVTRRLVFGEMKRLVARGKNNGQPSQKYKMYYLSSTRFTRWFSVVNV